MDKVVTRVEYKAVIDSETLEETVELEHKRYVLHSIDAQTPFGQRLEPRVEPVRPSLEIQGYYCEYAWDAQGDGK